MSLGKACEPHNIPATICVACRAAEEERERIIAAVEGFIDNPHTIEDDCDSCNVHRAILALIRGE